MTQTSDWGLPDKLRGLAHWLRCERMELNAEFVLKAAAEIDNARAPRTEQRTEREKAHALLDAWIDARAREVEIAAKCESDDEPPAEMLDAYRIALREVTRAENALFKAVRSLHPYPPAAEETQP